MAKYLIKVESMDMDEALDERYTNGIECDSFCIVADNDEDTAVCIHQMSLQGLAEAFADSPTLLAAGHIGKAIKEGNDMKRKEDLGNILKHIMRRDDD